MADEAETNLPAETPAGVDAASAATDDDNDTSKFDRMEAPDEDDAEQTPAGDGEGEDGEQSDADKAKAAAEAGTVEVEADDGTKHRVPKALEAHLLRQSAFTQKTQALAEERRAVEAERSTLETRAAEIEASRTALPAEHQRIAIIDHTIAGVKAQIAAFQDDVDWDTFRAQAAEDPSRKALYDKTRLDWDAAKDRLNELTTERGAATKDLSDKEQARLEGVRTKAEEASVTAWKETETALADEKTGIPGWSPEKASELAKVAVTEFGVTAEELQGLHDPRFWKLFSAVASERARADKAEAALKQKTTADNHGKAQTTTPAATVKGSGASARDPATPRGDALATKEWMTRRNAQKAQAAR